jgi:hypothetical protein
LHIYLSYRSLRPTCGRNPCSGDPHGIGHSHTSFCVAHADSLPSFRDPDAHRDASAGDTNQNSPPSITDIYSVPSTPHAHKHARDSYIDAYRRIDKHIDTDEHARANPYTAADKYTRTDEHGAARDH